MKKTMRFAAGLACAVFAIVNITGCHHSSDTAAADTRPAPQQIVPAPGMNKIDVNVTLVDKRLNIISGGFGTSSFEFPEKYYTLTIDVAGFTSEYIRRMNLFKSINCAVPVKGAYTLQMVWHSSLTNINTWIPFVVKYINHMEFTMNLISPKGKTVWTYHFNDQVTNTPSSFRRRPPLNLFQQRCMEPNLTAAMADLCSKVAEKPEILK